MEDITLSETNLCRSCDERQKEIDQIVCDYCHENELLPEEI